MFDGMYWFPATTRDPRVVDLFSRHYSSGKNGATRRDWLDHGIKGPGESIVLLGVDCLGLYVWLKQSFDSADGVYCSVFRNEGGMLSSDLILEAEQIAWDRWPGERLFTLVNPDEVGSSNPGYCFIKAGWRRLKEKTGRGLRMLEKYPPIVD